MTEAKKAFDSKRGKIFSWVVQRMVGWWVDGRETGFFLFLYVLRGNF